ncbi:MAG: endonuclease [Saprospiraceae bacterium]|nr:endonuclease [Saprospiraceae bacterium]
MFKRKQLSANFFGLQTSSFGLILSFLFILNTACSQVDNKKENTGKPKASYTIAFYNVENLFDTIDDPKTNDQEFLPTDKKKWDTKKYTTKVNNISKVLASVDENLPIIIGLCEIENKSVVEDLVKTKFLQKGKYQIIHQESPDFRGIDNAFLYKKKDFKYLYYKAISVKLPDNPKFTTRDILYVKGLIKKDTFHIFVNHWPSRSGGQKKSEHKRIQAAKTLKHTVDSIYAVNPKANIIIMGDFNDEPTDKSIEVLTKSKTDNLINLTAKCTKADEGSYYYWKTKEWNKLDQIIVSKDFPYSNSYSIEFEYHIFKPEWILAKEGEVMAPSKTFAKGYNGGYSDHLPVFLKLLYYK